jgi:Gpi18-like mannosyltransferase
MLKNIIIAGFLLRISIAITVYHGDVIDSLNWGKDLVNLGLNGFYFRDIADAGPPNYPPLYYYILLANQYIYLFLLKILWNINTIIKVFPSNVYLWFESDLGRIFFNKLPSIIADTAIAYLIFLLVKSLRNKISAIKYAALFLFLPPSWYLSSLWGQTESLFVLPLITSFYLMYKRYYKLAPLMFLISLMVKPTALLLTPIFLYWWLKRAETREILWSAFMSMLFFILIHIPFNNDGLIWVFDLYRYNIREVLGYLTANAFNIWGLIYGFSPVSDSLNIFGLSAFHWGLVLYLIFIVYMFKNLSKLSINKVVSGLTLVSLFSFLFLTRMHERYYYLVFIFLGILSGFDGKVKKLYLLSSAVFLVNLYHFWWVPRVDILVNIFSNVFVEKILIVFNLYVFLILLRRYSASYNEERK